MECQVCEQGIVLEVRLNALDETAYLCDECHALWFRKGFVELRPYLLNRGRTLETSEVTILKELEDDPA
jgi:hypothetical protein